jgi:dynein heavy chain
MYVVVTNCTDQFKYTDCAKMFKGLCQSGLWGCFDEFNRITLPVLSVVAQQVQAIQNAQKQGLDTFYFPGDSEPVQLRSSCAFFITMNPGYAGRQELPENLKALFRGVAMMTPDFQIIMKVKMCACGYKNFDTWSKKFFSLYSTCKEQLSNQRHYDWGLRNISSVLRTMGKTKRDDKHESEDVLVYRTLRDMNLSKLVAQDVPLFNSLLADLFPGISNPPKSKLPAEEAILRDIFQEKELVDHSSWVLKIMQFYETTKVRHGVMLVGPSGGGKSRIFECLREMLQRHQKVEYREARFNPKAIRAQEMYGEVDSQTEEWITGVFAAMWERYNKRENPYTTWIIADGPIDAIWIEDLNTVLDDNKILTLANGDRMQMTDNVKMMFEVETLINASPATVSRAGIIYVSDTDLDWSPIIEAWVQKRPKSMHDPIRNLIKKWLGHAVPGNPGPCFSFLAKNTNEVLNEGRAGRILSFCELFASLTENTEEFDITDTNDLPARLEKVFVYSLCWSIAGLLETPDRIKFDGWLRKFDTKKSMPTVEEGETVFEYFVDPKTCQWKKWTPTPWMSPPADQFDFSNILIPTLDSTRAIYVTDKVYKQHRPVLLVGAEGTAKTSVQLMFLGDQDQQTTLVKRINFSSATTPNMAQRSVENELDKRGGKKFGPPNGKKMTVFFDDFSMPEVNTWGDQPTLELVRLLVEQKGFYFLDKEKRGDFKSCEDLSYVAAMQHPGGGKNDIPNRLKRNFFIFNLILPSITSINDIYGQMLGARFTQDVFDADTLQVTDKLTQATIGLWEKMKDKMLPTPSKFHYIFNLRDLSRVFQGILHVPNASISETEKSSPSMLLGLWKHECDRVFCDKLASISDKEEYERIIQTTGIEAFGNDGYTQACTNPNVMASFLRDDMVDEEGIVTEPARKVYEDAASFGKVRDRTNLFLQRYNQEFPSKKMDLVLFDDALMHLLRISRLICMPRGSALLVGVGGSGKQSLAKLAAFVSGAECFQITLTKTYNETALREDLKLQFQKAGHKGKPIAFIFTENEIKDEVFLESFNSFLSTGEVPGLFTKEEMLAMTADLSQAFRKERSGLDETIDNLKQFFTDRVRDNLHMILCMSPMNPKFPIRARKFPSLVSSPTIDWFLPWPEEALVNVCQGFLAKSEFDCTADTKETLISHIGAVHGIVTATCDEYFKSMRRQVYQTPKSFLSFIDAYKTMYETKLGALNEKETRVNKGLVKLIQGAEDVEKMKVTLQGKQVDLQAQTEEANKSFKKVEESKKMAEVEEALTNEKKEAAHRDAEDIAEERTIINAQLEEAMPHVHAAEEAINKITGKDISEIKNLANPSDIIKIVFDCVLVLFQRALKPVTACTITLNKKQVSWIEPSFKPEATAVMGKADFLGSLQKFGGEGGGRDKMNDETIEFLSVYTSELEPIGFTPSQAKKASQAAEGLCTYVQALEKYHNSSKIVKPQQESLKVAEARQAKADDEVKVAEAKVVALKEHVKGLEQKASSLLAKKDLLTKGANELKAKMEQAATLINGLAGERQRWTEDAKNFKDQKKRLVGDCALGCAFISYCGPFNQDFRRLLIMDRFHADCERRDLPVTRNLDITSFLADSSTIGNWNLQGLPTDSLSIQNGILVTSSKRYPLLIDPQGQALTWISNKEKDNLPLYNKQSMFQITDGNLKDSLQFCMANGKSMIIMGVEEEIDPLFNPVLDQEILIKNNKKSIDVGGTKMELEDGFSIFFITRLPNPKFSPELQAKTTLIDFTVTQKGLEEQLLGKVIGKEQKALEEQLSDILQGVVANTKSLKDLDASLLQRLSENSGNLLDDDELIAVLEKTKAQAEEVNLKLKSADEAKRSIDEKREQFRPVATRGAVLYFSIVNIGLVNVMYQTSLDQFLDIFMGSMEKSEKSNLASKRVANIISTLTYDTYRYINCGLFERDKLTFRLLMAMKILVSAGHMRPEDIFLFLKAGASLDKNGVTAKTFDWMSQEVWLNVNELSRKHKFYTNLIGDIKGNEAAWKRWYSDNEPERMPLPDYQQKVDAESDIGPFLKLLLMRCLRFDRSIPTSMEFLRDTEELGPAFVQPVTDTIETIYEDMVANVPVIFLLSRGSDPTEGIEALSKKKKIATEPNKVSLGEGQEPVARNAVKSGAQFGTWVLLQNCELALSFMSEMEGLLSDLETSMDPKFRLFITALPHPLFPLGLLQMSTKVTNEPPAGLRAGLLRSYTPGVLVDQDKIERIDTDQWRKILFALCYLHSVVQERRKFGSIGWCVPYEYNNADLQSCLLFLEKHLENGPISWSTFQYMVSAVQYGGKITDSLDNRLFRTYTEEWLVEATCEDGFIFNPSQPLSKIPDDFPYHVPSYPEHAEYQRYIKAFPETDSPELFGLHPNADLTFRQNESNALINSLLETQPKDSGGGDGGSREDTVLEKCTDFLRRLPSDFVEEEYKEQIDKLGGLKQPMNIFLFQEVQRLQDVIGKVRSTLTELQLAIKGEVVMTTELQDMLDSIFDARVPHYWENTLTGDEFSWRLPNLGEWFTSLLNRDKQNRTWLTSGRPKCFWLTGFFNPNGCLTAMKQEVTRLHKEKDKWALDEVVYSTSVTRFERPDQVKNPPEEGIYVYGLFVEGASWNRQEEHLQESEPKKLFTSLPVLHITGKREKEERISLKKVYGGMGPYVCPVYKYKNRTDRYFIFNANLKCSETEDTQGKKKGPNHWVLRGVALLCNI